MSRKSDGSHLSICDVQCVIIHDHGAGTAHNFHTAGTGTGTTVKLVESAGSGCSVMLSYIKAVLNAVTCCVWPLPNAAVCGVCTGEVGRGNEV